MLKMCKIPGGQRAKAGTFKDRKTGGVVGLLETPRLQPKLRLKGQPSGFSSLAKEGGDFDGGLEWEREERERWVQSKPEEVEDWHPSGEEGEEEEEEEEEEVKEKRGEGNKKEKKDRKKEQEIEDSSGRHLESELELEREPETENTHKGQNKQQKSNEEFSEEDCAQHFSPKQLKFIKNRWGSAAEFFVKTKRSPFKPFDVVMAEGQVSGMMMDEDEDAYPDGYITRGTSSKTRGFFQQLQQAANDRYLGR